MGKAKSFSENFNQDFLENKNSKLDDFVATPLRW